MKTFRFRDFVIYRDAREFRKIVRVAMMTFPSSEQFRLSDQIHRSSLSVLLNIAEGSAKSTDKEFARFLTMSISSLNETVAGFDVSFDDGFITADGLRNLESHAERLAKEIGSFIQRLRQTKKLPAKSQQPIATSQ